MTSRCCDCGNQTDARQTQSFISRSSRWTYVILKSRNDRAESQRDTMAVRQSQGELMLQVLLAITRHQDHITRSQFQLSDAWRRRIRQARRTFLRRLKILQAEPMARP
eukprot:scaffold179482_cov40-Tisochrysis_lutea.AAC.2